MSAMDHLDNHPEGTNFCCFFKGHTYWHTCWKSACLILIFIFPVTSLFCNLQNLHLQKKKEPNNSTQPPKTKSSTTMWYIVKITLNSIVFSSLHFAVPF